VDVIRVGAWARVSIPAGACEDDQHEADDDDEHDRSGEPERAALT